jgi:hypothetical protein
MSDLTDVCTLCAADITAKLTGVGQAPVVINTDVHTPGPCFVADQIEFLDSGKLIFDTVQGQGQNEYAVICRKLIVNGGNKPGNITPCNPGDPGTRYDNTNVITWNGRLQSAQAGNPPNPPAAASTAEDGAAGQNGATGNPGNPGIQPGGTGQGKDGKPAKLVVMALEVVIANSGNLVIDWAGQDGGDGGQGQTGQKGDKGTTGSGGSDASWPSSGCDTAAGDGGPGGPGGIGGTGGSGGKGGDAGQIIVISLPQNLSSTGVFNNPSKISFVTKSIGGKGGPGGKGGNGGAGGKGGKKSSDCDAGGTGSDLTFISSADGGTGVAGPPGASTAPALEAITGGACGSRLPVALQFDPSNVLPNVLRRCFSGSGSGDISLTGQFLDQIVSVSTSLTGVTATIKNSSTDTELDLSMSLAANSATGLGDLIFTYNFPGSFGPTQTLAGAINVEVCKILSILPASLAQGATQTGVTITGTSFDPSAPNHDVSISGLGVNVVNVAAVDDQTMTCDIEVSATAAKGARDVTVKAGSALGPCQHTLVGGFSVT